MEFQGIKHHSEWGYKRFLTRWVYAKKWVRTSRKKTIKREGGKREREREREGGWGVKKDFISSCIPCKIGSSCSSSLEFLESSLKSTPNRVLLISLITSLILPPRRETEFESFSNVSGSHLYRWFLRCRSWPRLTTPKRMRSLLTRQLPHSLSFSFSLLLPPVFFLSRSLGLFLAATSFYLFLSAPFFFLSHVARSFLRFFFSLHLPREMRFRIGYESPDTDITCDPIVFSSSLTIFQTYIYRLMYG